MKIKNIINSFEKLSFSVKTIILSFIITGGMITVIVLSQVSMYVIKNDFDILFEKRTKTIVQLINIKDTYKINIYDTLKDLHDKHLNHIQAAEIILLGQQLINKNWLEYKNSFYNIKKENFAILFVKNIFTNEEKDKAIFKKHIISDIDKKFLTIDHDITKIMKLLKTRKNANLYIKNMYLKINSIDISLSDLTMYDNKLAIEEKQITQNAFEKITFYLNIAIISIFIITLLLSLVLLKYIKKSNLYLEKSVQETTKELREINTYLEVKIEKEVTDSRKKDLVIFQQAKLASLGEMLSNIAHQWRQPLGSLMMIIQSFKSKMEMGKLTDTLIKEKVTDALYLADNMSNTLEDFQNFFNPNKDKTHFFISDCISHTLTLSKYLLEQENIKIIIDIKSNTKIYSFYNELSHVILNLISNSKDALKDKKNPKIIKINVKKSNNNIKINLYDNGGGIDKEILPKIFEPYYTTKYKSAGTGIGLYMSKQIIEKHMLGDIKGTNIYYKINSNKFEDCTLFSIIIPILDKSS